MWLLILMSSKWHAKDYDTEDDLRVAMADVFEHVYTGNVVSITDDLECWCDEMQINQENVIIVN